LSTEPADSMAPKFFPFSCLLMGYIDYLLILFIHLIKQVLGVRLITLPLLLYYDHPS